LGRAFAHEFAKLNATVVLVDSSKARGEVLVKSINDNYRGTVAYFYECDVRRQECLTETIKAITKDVGDVSILMNCSTTEYLLASYYNVYKLLLPIMKGNQSGQLVFIKSFDAQSRNVIQSLYDSIHEDLELSGTKDVITTMAYVFPRIGQDGEKNKVFGNITPEALAAEVLDGISRKRKEVFVPEYMAYMSWSRLLPSPITNLVEKFLSR
jgi:short chain dehydrogenase